MALHAPFGYSKPAKPYGLLMENLMDVCTKGKEVHAQRLKILGYATSKIAIAEFFLPFYGLLFIFIALGLTRHSSRPAYCGRLTLPVM